MITKTITLFYKLTQSDIISPQQKEIARKDDWIKKIQSTVEADYKPKIVRVQYEIFDPEVENQRRFFEGAVKMYYAIQDMDLMEGVPDSATLKKYREEMLDGLTGYDVKTVNKTLRKRKSTSDLKTVQAWNKLLKLAEETLFHDAGYEFPNSEEFWDLVKEQGYEKAKETSIKRLQAIMKSRYGKG